MSDNILYLNSANFADEIERFNGLALVDFYADWCGPCRMLAPIIESLAKQFVGKVKVCKINTDEAQDISAKYQITGIPAVLIFKNGEVIDNLVGFRPIEAYQKSLNTHLAK